VLGLCSLFRPRWQVLSSSKTAPVQINEAQALVLQSRTKTSQAKSRLEGHRGVGALPNAEKTQIFKHFAHDSSVRDASLMAVDTSGNFEMDLQRLLDEEV
jgi:hypothetical protein